MYGIHYYMNPFKTTFWNKNSARPMGSYNALVDLMGHEHLGGKVMLCLVDGIYSSVNQGSDIKKWQSAPFNNDWTSSIFASQDFVAIESVCLDFLVAEPTMVYNKGSLDNYLHEGAQADDPPSGTFYDPEGDGTPLASLGAHEHWNNAVDKQYSRNLGTGEGIELVKVFRDSKPPAAPANLTAIEGHAQVILTWDSCGEGVTYSVKREKESEGFETIATGLTECSYVDVNVVNGITYKYIVTATGEFGESENSIEVTAVPREPVSVEDEPVQFELMLTNFPNPFNPSTRLSYTIPEEGHVSLMVFNLLGQRIATLVDTNLPAGQYATNWNGVNNLGERVSGGVYLVRLQAGNSVMTRKITLLY